MGVLNKSLSFYCCTNGLGHYKRVYEVAKHLINDFNITIYCSINQSLKIGVLSNVNYVYYKYDNIRWDKVLKGETEEMFQEYSKWLKEYGPTVNLYDKVISDNIVGLLDYRDDIVLMGSFFWKDVFQSKLRTNNISSRDEVLLDTYKPTLITNKYLETQSVKEYNNKKQFGFGCRPRMQCAADIKHTIWLPPSLDYGDGYSNFVEKAAKELNFDLTSNFSYIYNVRIIGRPGVGTITHCVEHFIPLVALYSDEDSEEIKELAHIVEDLKIGFKQNINEPIRTTQFKLQSSNTNYCYAEKFEKDGYIKIAELLKNG